MNKNTYLLLGFILLIVAISCTNLSILSTKEKEYLQKNDSINVAVFPYYPPYQFKNNQGEIEGIFIDYLELIEKK